MAAPQYSGSVKSGHAADSPTNHGTLQRAASSTRKGEHFSEGSLPSDDADDDISSPSNLSDGHIPASSRRTSISSQTAWSVSGHCIIAQPDIFPEVHVRDPSELKGEIERPDPEFILPKDEEPRLQAQDIQTKIDNSIARAAIRGQGFSIPSIEKPSVKTGTGEATNPSALSDPILNLTRVPLQQRLLAERQRRGKEFFLPSKRVESLIHPQNVAEELTICLHRIIDPRGIQDVAKTVCAIPAAEAKSYRKIFAILTIIEKMDAILEFIRGGIHDGDLPFTKLEVDGKPGIFKLGRKLHDAKGAQPLKCFAGFSLMNLINFEEYQWAVLALIFDRPRRKDVKHYYLEDQAILPFIQEQEVSGGGFGQISRVDIHPDHHNFSGSGTHDNKFAVKRLNSHDERVFRGEFEMLSKFSDDAHPHLISLLAAYTHRMSFYLIFHWAEADLVKFWREINPQPSVARTVHWVAKQCAGLASGLLQIHRYESIPNGPTTDGSLVKTKLYGRHGDIKPANILWFPNLADANDGGTLRLTDFGLAEFHTLHSRSNLSKSGIATSPSYRPPEYDIVDGKISRSFDIWTLGCLYVEFITWLLGGWNLVRQFTIERATPIATRCLEQLDYSFFDLVENGKTAKIKESVTRFIKMELHGHPACTEYLHEFLDLVEKELLIIETGEISSNKRVDCGPLRSTLESMYQKCNINLEYALTPAPRSYEFENSHVPIADTRLASI
ncbi:hypothetical protein EKO27_g1899 [Xylaria grammica]|uniref:Protein kinase domain-containing protein n=1 Tax=Xylaria grammica TaxID=363999 RepID=A0A439DFM2_9PEZI|nr:hypothetical protein EKO27_g1899 [Xylaria grammica]